jgi:Tfp pilus assembly protein PilF
MTCRGRKTAHASSLSLAVSLLLGALGCAPLADDRSRLYTEDGVQLFARGDYLNAVDSFELALTMTPRDPVLLFNVAECYDRLGNAKQAEEYYLYCLQQAPDHADARLALVALYYRTGRTAPANKMIAEWLTQHPQSADAFVLDAWRLRQEKDLPHAQGRLQQALDAEPHNPRALAEMAYLYESMGMPERAYVLYERMLSRDPNRADIARRLRALQNKGIERPKPE